MPFFTRPLLSIVSCILLRLWTTIMHKVRQDFRKSGKTKTCLMSLCVSCFLGFLFGGGGWKKRQVSFIKTLKPETHFAVLTFAKHKSCKQVIRKRLRSTSQGPHFFLWFFFPPSCNNRKRSVAIEYCSNCQPWWLPVRQKKNNKKLSLLQKVPSYLTLHSSVCVRTLLT